MAPRKGCSGGADRVPSRPLRLLLLLLLRLLGLLLEPGASGRRIQRAARTPGRARPLPRGPPPLEERASVR